MGFNSAFKVLKDRAWPTSAPVTDTFSQSDFPPEGERLQSKASTQPHP